MRHGLFPLAFGLGVSASALQSIWQECKFTLVSEDAGNARLASEFQTENFLLESSTGTLKNGKGHGCKWDKEQKIKCYEGHAGTPGWQFVNGELRHKDCREFVSCPYENGKGWNIYKYPCEHKLKCKPIHLKGSCGRKSPHAPIIYQPQVGNTPEVVECLKWCKARDFECQKHCHTLAEIPPPAPSHPEDYPHHHEPCDKCGKKNCSCGHNKPLPPCEKCGKKTCGCGPKPKPLCDKCGKKTCGCGNGHWARSVETTEAVEGAEGVMACGDCPRSDYRCHDKCYGPRPPPCNKCNKKPACEKKCWNTEYHHHHHHEYPEIPVYPENRHKEPVCCTKCETWDKECFKKCYPPSASDERLEYWKPEHPHHHHEHHQHKVPCHKCHPKKPECHKSCRPSPCNKCRPEHKGCTKTCFSPRPHCQKPHHQRPRPVPCHKCQPKHHSCHKTCKKPIHYAPPYPWVKPWPQPGPKPSPFPPCCDTCKPHHKTCHEGCISRAGMERFVTAWEENVKPEAAKQMTNDQMYEKVQDYLEEATVEEQAAAEAEAEAEAENFDEQQAFDEQQLAEQVVAEEQQAIADAEAAKEQQNAEQGEGLNDLAVDNDKKADSKNLDKRDEATESEVFDVADAANQCRCPHGDRECFKNCAIKEHKKPCFSCNDCHAKKGDCGKAKNCHRIYPKPCNSCHKHKDEDRCKKTCYKKPEFPILCSECRPGDYKCFDHCVIPESHHHGKPCGKCGHHGPKPCNKCSKPTSTPIKPCYKCNKPKPVPVKPCDKCHEDKPCDKHHHHEHRPIHCGDCKKGDKICEKKCKPYLPPPAPPKQPPKCCDECGPKDWNCLETCFLKPGQKIGPSEEVKCCLRNCKHDDWKCKKSCWEKEYAGEKPHGEWPKGEKPQGEKPQGGKPQEEGPPGGWPDHVKQEGGEQGKPQGGPPAGGPPAGKPTSAPAPTTAKPTSAAPTSSKATSSTAYASPNYVAPAKPTVATGQAFGACPASLSGEHQFPSAVQAIPNNPHTKILGSGAKINSETSTVFTISIPESYKGKTCSLFFYFPSAGTVADVKTNAQGSASFDLVSKPGNGANVKTKVWKHLNDIPLRAGTTYWVADHACQPGEVSFGIDSKNGLKLEFPEKQPIGLFVKAC